MSKPKRVLLIVIIVTLVGWLLLAAANNFLEWCIGIKEEVKEDSRKEPIRDPVSERKTFEI